MSNITIDRAAIARIVEEAAALATGARKADSSTYLDAARTEAHNTIDLLFSRRFEDASRAVGRCVDFFVIGKKIQKREQQDIVEEAERAAAERRLEINIELTKVLNSGQITNPALRKRLRKQYDIDTRKFD